MINTVLLDIDGVLTDGAVYVSADGKETKRILFEDIDAIFALKRAGLKIGFITGEDNEFCDYEFKQIKSEENTITYEIIEKIDEIKTYRSFNCRTKITDTTSLLGNAPLSTKEISISAEYIFESEENIRLSIT